MSDHRTTSYADAPDGVSLCFQVTGEGPLNLVWIPSISYPFDLLWDEPGFARLTRRLGAFARVLWPEMRGIGASGGEYLDNFSTSGLDADLSALTDAAGFDRFVLVGSGLWGWTAVHYATSHPEQLAAIILVDAYAHYARQPGYPVGFSARALEAVVNDVRARWGAGSSAVLAPTKAGDSAFVERLARAERLGVSPDQAAEAIRRTLLVDVRGDLPAISAPTLVLHREGDAFIRPEAGRYLAEEIPGARYVELPGVDHLFYTDDVDALADGIEEFLTGGHQGAEGDVVTKTVLFTDIVSSTEQSARMGHRKWTSVIADHDVMVRAALVRHRGEEVKTIGDGFLAVFDATTRAVRAAAEIVRAAKGIGLELRAGVHTGEVEVLADDVMGLPVSIAKRVCDLAGPAQVFVTEVVRLQVTGSDIELQEQGDHEIKGVPGSWRLYSVKG